MGELAPSRSQEPDPWEGGNAHYFIFCTKCVHAGSPETTETDGSSSNVEQSLSKFSQLSGEFLELSVSLN